jgi:ABC-2 type transport system permease protein
MKAALAVAGRDLRGFFGTPLGWMAACIIFLASGSVFFIVVDHLLTRGQAMDPVADILGQILQFMNYIYIFIIPAFTMRVLSDELATGTYRLQAVAPISVWSIVAGKFLGILGYFALIGLLLLLYPLFTVIFTQPDLGVLASGWLGLILNTAAIISVSLFVASLTRNPVLSYLGSAFLILMFLFSSFLPGVPEWYKHSANILSLAKDFSSGVIETSTVATFLAIIASFLVLTHFVLKNRKWRV